MPARRACVFLLLAFVACRKSEVEPVPLELEPGELAILAVGDAEGKLRTGAVTGLEAPAFRIARQEGEILYAWVLNPSRELLGPGGAALEPAMLEGFRIRVAGKLQPREGAIRAVTAHAAREPGEGDRMGGDENGGDENGGDENGGDENGGDENGAEVGRCGRCLVPAIAAPKLALPGESCPLGALGRAQTFPTAVSDSALARARRELMIEWPGECPCSIDQYPQNAPSHRVEVLDPAPHGWPIEASACTPDETAGLFSQQLARLSGRSADPTDRTENLPFDAVLIGAVPLDDGSFLVASQPASFPRHAPTFSLFAPGREPLSMRGPEMLVIRMINLPGDPRPILIGGDCFIGCTAAIRACERNPGTSAFDCHAIFPVTNRSAFAPLMLELAALDDDLYAATRVDGAIALGAATPAAGPCDELQGCVEDGSRQLRWTAFAGFPVPPALLRPGASFVRFDALVASGSRLFACAIDDDRGDLAATIVTATITRDPVLAAASATAPPAIDFQKIAGPYASTRCGSVSLEGAPAPNLIPGAAMIFLLDDGRAIALDRQGRIVLGADDPVDAGPLVGLPGRVSAIRRPVPECLLAKNEDDRWVRLGASTNFSSAEPIFGPVRENLGPVTRGISSTGDDFWIFKDGGEIFVLKSTGILDRRVLNHFRDTTFGPAVHDPDLSRPEGEGDERFLVAASKGEESFLLRVEGESVEGESATATPLISLPDGERVRGMVATAPGVQVLITDRGRILRHRAAALEEVEIDWDDPATQPEREHRPEAGGCVVPAELDAPPRNPDDIFRAIDAAKGVAWIGGCGGLILRVDEARAHRIAIGRLPPDELLAGDPGPSFTAIRALCADRALAGTRAPDGLDTDDRTGWIVEVRPTREGEAAEDGLALDTYASNENAIQGPLYVGAPIAILGGASNTSVVFSTPGSGSFHAFTSAQRIVFPRRFIAAAASSSGAVLAVSESERLVLISPPPE